MEEYLSTFISEQEKDIIVLKNNGISFIEIGNRLNCSSGEIEKNISLQWAK